MGPPKASDLLRECLYMGADAAYLVSDRKFAGADTLATSYVLSAAIRKIGEFDVVFAGRQAIDGDTAQVGPQTAEKLGIPQITYLERLVDLAEYLSGKVDSIKEQVGDVGDDRLCVMAALTVVDELWEARAKLKDLEILLESKGGASLTPSKELVENIEAAAERIENLKDQLIRGASIPD